MKTNNFNNLKTTCHTRPNRVSRGMIFNNKELASAGSSGRANAAPRMTKNKQYAAPRMTECGRSTPSLSLRGGFANEAISCRLPRPIGLAMTGYKKCGLAMTGECGRSMVEMLGVLAVMGVLSVAGIAGYNSAMNKYRANELLNEASKRAVIVAMQITSGKAGTGLSVTEFTNPSGYKFGVDTSYAAGDKTFSLTLSKNPSGDIDESICTQMIAATGTNSAMLVAPGCGTITFNADMSKGVASASGSAYDENAGAKACTTNADCDAGCQQCSSGKCISKCDVGQYCGQGTSGSDYACVSVTPTTCTSDTNCSSSMAPCCANGSCTVPTCPSGTFWGDYGPDTWGCLDSNGSFQSSGTCSNEIKGCTSNADCDTPDEYCEIRSTTWSCSSLDVGRCTSVGTPNTVAKAEGVSGSAYNGYVYSSQTKSWWAADNWCKAQGMRLVSLSDLNLSEPTSSSCSGTGCKDASGNNMTTAKWQVLKDAFGSRYFWTVDSYNSCVANSVTLGATVERIDRYNLRYALCK